MIQFQSSPYLGVPLGLGQLVPRSTEQQQMEPPAQAVQQGFVAAPQAGDPSFPDAWYKKPSVIVGGVVGLLVLGGLGWWAFK